jgi:hypothetical protein
MGRKPPSQLHPLGQYKWKLSDSAEAAIARLKKCDPNVLRGHIHTWRQFPTRLSPKQWIAFDRRLERQIADLRAFSTTFDGLWLFPPLGRSTLLHNMINQLDELRGLLLAWRKRRRRQRPDRNAPRAFLCAEVIRRSGQPHDSEVADLWAELDDRDEPWTAEDVRQFRLRHRSLVQHAIEALNTASAPSLLGEHAGPPPKPQN